MTDITYQSATIDLPAKAIYCRGSTPGAPISWKTSAKARKSPPVTALYRSFRPRNSPGAVLTVTTIARTALTGY